MLPKPKNVRLFGANPAEQEESRDVNTCRITFDLVATAESYGCRVNGVVVPGNFQQGDWVNSGGANHLVAVEIQARKAGEPPSPWSDPFTTVSRPPTPPVPHRLPYDLSEFGIVIAWSVPAGFPGDAQAGVMVRRDAADLAPEPGLDGSYVDSAYAQGVPHAYAVQTQIPRSAVPQDVLGAANLSFDSPTVILVGPVRKMSTRRTEAFLAKIRDVEVTILRRICR